MKSFFCIKIELGPNSWVTPILVLTGYWVKHCVALLHFVFLLRVTYITFSYPKIMLNTKRSLDCFKAGKRSEVGHRHWRVQGQGRGWKQWRRQGSSGALRSPQSDRSLLVCFYMYVNMPQAHTLFSSCIFLRLIRYKTKEPKSEVKQQTNSLHWHKMVCLTLAKKI